MRSPFRADLRVALRCVFPLLILLVVLAGCATSDSVSRGAKLPGGAAAATTRFFVNLSSRPHLQAAAAISDYAGRGQFVVDELRRNAAASQGPVISFLDQRNVKYEAFWIANTIVVEGDEETRRLVAGLPGVESIEDDAQVALDDPPATASAALQPAPDATGLAIEPNVSRVNAPAVWDMGADGTGIVVGVMDTGFQPHPAIAKQFRGEWLDVSGTRCGSPCDDNGHGTHVTGTILGRDGANAIGVAPGAKFIACKALRNGSGEWSAVITCLQWFMMSSNPELRPQIISMSLGAGTSSVALAEAMTSLQAAGTLPVAAAGNNGACKTISYPGGLSNVLAVGALTEDESTNMLAAYSSSGPLPNSSQIKPDVVAQGSSVRSAWLSGAYRTISGTSMATPAVSGVAALVMSARPSWVGHPADVAQLLRETSNGNVSAPNRPACNGGYPGNATGWGLVDAQAAVIRAEMPPSRRQ
jgi:subtilisin family serine protease